MYKVVMCRHFYFRVNIPPVSLLYSILANSCNKIVIKSMFGEKKITNFRSEKSSRQVYNLN